MVQSTVGSSLANAITYLAGGKERDAALAGQLLQNQQRSALIRGQQLANDELDDKANLRAEREAVAPLLERGVIELNTDPDAVGMFKFNFDLTQQGDVAKVIGPNSGILKTLNTNTNAVEGLEFVDFAPAPGDRGNYVALVRNSSGEVVPMTVNATNDDNDPVMKFSRGQIERLMADRVAVLSSRGAFENESLSRAATARAANEALGTTQQRRRTQLLAVIDPVVDQLAEENPAAGRALASAASSTDSNEELEGIIEDLGGEVPPSPQPEAQPEPTTAIGNIDEYRDLVARRDAMRDQMRASRGATPQAAEQFRELNEQIREMEQAALAQNQPRIDALEGELATLRSQKSYAERQARRAPSARSESIARQRMFDSGPPQRDYDSEISAKEAELQRLRTFDPALLSAAPAPEPAPAEAPAAPNPNIPPEVPATTQEVVAGIDAGEVPTITPQAASDAAQYFESRNVYTLDDLDKLDEQEKAFLLHSAAAIQFARDPAQARANLQALINIAQTGNPGTNPDNVRRTDIDQTNAQTSAANTELRSRELINTLQKAGRDISSEEQKRLDTFTEAVNNVELAIAEEEMPLSNATWLASVNNLQRSMRTERDPTLRAMYADMAAEVVFRGVAKTAVNQNDGFFGWVADLFKPGAPDYQIGSTLRQINWVRTSNGNVKELVVSTRAPGPGETMGPDTRSEITFQQLRRYMSVEDINWLANYTDQLKATVQQAYNSEG